MRRTWIKLWVDQCLRGSMISELNPEQRWIFIGILLLAGDSEISGVVFRRKDENGKLIGYHAIVLADTLGVDPETIGPALVKMVEKNKITIDEAGVIYVSNWAKYQSEYERKKAGRTNVRPDDGQMSDLDRDRDGDGEEERRDGHSVPLSQEQIDKDFEDFWNAYPREGRHARKESRIKFGALVKRGELEEFIKGFEGYLDFLKDRHTRDNFDQRPMYAKTFINDRWREYVGFEYKAAL